MRWSKAVLTAELRHEGDTGESALYSAWQVVSKFSFVFCHSREIGKVPLLTDSRDVGEICRSCFGSQDLKVAYDELQTSSPSEWLEVNFGLVLGLKAKQSLAMRYAVQHVCYYKSNQRVSNTVVQGLSR